MSYKRGDEVSITFRGKVMDIIDNEEGLRIEVDGTDWYAVVPDYTARLIQCATPKGPKYPCKGFQWIGQSLKHCDGCGFPFWEHMYEERLRQDASPFDRGESSFQYVPITADHARAVKKKWDHD